MADQQIEDIDDIGEALATGDLFIGVNVSDTTSEDAGGKTVRFAASRVLTLVQGQTALGDLSDVTITAIASGEVLAWNGSAWINNTLAEAGIAAASHTHVEADITDLQAYLLNVVEDTTPQLGGSLDVNGNKIVSTSNGNIDIEPNGTGNVLLGNFTLDADQTVGAGQDNYVLTYDNGTGLISLEAAAGGGGSPGGSDTQIQYNNSGAFGGTSGLTWTSASSILTHTGAYPIQSRFPDGSVIAGNGPGIAFASYTDTGIAANGDNLAIWESGTIALNLTSLLKEYRIPSDFAFCFSSATNNNAPADTYFLRDAANTIAFRNGTNAQTWNFYNTFTDSSNYERLQAIWAANTCHFAIQAAGTGTVRNFKLQSAGTTRLESDSTGLGFFAATPVAQPSSTGETTGFTAGSGTGVNDDSTFTGNVGTTAYRISDIVKHLKNLGLIAS